MTAEGEGRSRAAEFRREHGLGVLPLGDLVALIELTQGLDVAILDATIDEHGMTMRDPERGVVVVAAACTDHPTRQRSTLAHELGHVLFNDWARPKTAGWDVRSHEEIRADVFARHLLVPTEGVQALLARKDTVTASDLSAMVQRFQASPQIVAIQMEQAGRIDQSRKKEWMSLSAPSLATRFGWMDQYRAWQVESNTRRAPQRLLARAVEGYISGVVSLETIARLRGISVEKVAAEFADTGIAAAETAIEWAQPGQLPRKEVDLSDLDTLLPEELE